MNLAELRDLVLDLRAWTSSGTTFDKRLNKAINLAYRKMSKDVPELLVPSIESHYVFKAQTTAATKASVRVLHSPTSDSTAIDSWVFEFTDSAGRVLGHSSSTVTWRPQTNGTWDGLMHIEATDAAGVVHRHQCREFWTTTDDNGDATFRVSIDRPFHNQAADSGLFSFRLHQPDIWLRSDYIKIADASAWDSSYKDDNVYRLDVGMVDRLKLRDFRGDTTGAPVGVFPGQHLQLPAPPAKPEVSTPSGLTWTDGAVAPGTFSFKYTLAWGTASEKEGYPKYTPGGHAEAIIESPPSPESAQISNPSTGGGIRIQLAPIDHMLNFGSGKSRYGRSGLRLRVYAARHAVSAGAIQLSSWPADGKFYLIKDLAYNHAGATTTPVEAHLDWQPRAAGGEISGDVPDMMRPLRENHVYRGWSLYPHQEKNFRIDFRVFRPPDPLSSDADHPMVEPDAESALIELVLYYLSLMDGADQGGAQVHLTNYVSELKSVRATHASPSGSVRPSTWDAVGISDWNLDKFQEV